MIVFHINFCYAYPSLFTTILEILSRLLALDHADLSGTDSYRFLLLFSACCLLLAPDFLAFWARLAAPALAVMFLDVDFD